MTGVSDAGIRKEGINKMRDMYYDVVIAGCEVAEQYTALHHKKNKKMIFLAGGIDETNVKRAISQVAPDVIDLGTG